MVKLAFILLSALMLFLVSPFLSVEEKVTFSQNIPAEAKPGADFIVRITIHNTVITGFARLQQYLPEGFTATEISNGGADFNIEDNSVQFNWKDLPASKDIEVTYRVTTDDHLTGIKMITGIFVFIEDGKTQRKQLPPAEINITASAMSATADPQVARRIVEVNKEKGIYRVDLTISPNGNTKSIQFADEIPDGFTADPIEVNSAKFTFVNQAAIFNWNQLTTENPFTITYMVRSGKPGPAPVINGELTYGDASTATNTTGARGAGENKPAPVPSAIQGNTNPRSSGDKKQPSAETPKINPTPAFVPVGEKGITFKVQISATQKSTTKDNKWFNAHYRINSDVELTYHEGWKKYLIGSFESYDAASHLREQTQMNVSDAFIVAYQDGVRIPVSKALKIKTYNQ